MPMQLSSHDDVNVAARNWIELQDAESQILIINNKQNSEYSSGFSSNLLDNLIYAFREHLHSANYIATVDILIAVQVNLT